MARGFPQAPTWAWAVMALGVVWLIVGMTLTSGRGALPPEVVAAAEASQSASRAAAIAEREAALAAEEARIDVAVLGDSYTDGSNMDSGPDARWPALLEEAHGWDMDLYAVGGSGFVNGAGTGESFQFRVEEIVAAAPEVVVVVGGHNDTAAPVAEVRAAIDGVLASLRSGLPNASIVVVGVLWPGEPSPAAVNINTALRAAATAQGVAFIDPLDRGNWLADTGTLIGSDGTHPTDDGHQELADRLGEALIAVGLPAG